MMNSRHVNYLFIHMPDGLTVTKKLIPTIPKGSLVVWFLLECFEDYLQKKEDYTIG